MNQALAWFAGNRVAANLLMLMILIAGMMALPQIRKETIPNLSLDMIVVQVPYPGASPAEVEQGICTRIEESVFDLDGIRKLSSIARESLCSVSIEIEKGFDVAKILDRVKSRIDSITSFPANAEKSVVKEISIRSRVINLIIAGPANERTLKQIAERIRDDLVELPSITQVETINIRPYEISIEVSDNALHSYNLSFSEIADSVQRSSLDLAGGVVKTPTGDVLLRSQGQAYWGKHFEQMLLRTEPDGSSITIGDVAEVIDGFEQSDLEGKFNEHPAVMLSVFRVGEQSVLDISEQVNHYLERTRPLLPDGITVNTWQDRSEMFKSRLDLLIRSAIVGLALVFCLLVLFLRLRLALWVSVGIAVSFMGALLVLPYFDSSINMISMFAFVLVLGIVVDDAIIVGENIFSQHRKGIFGLQAAINGTQDVARPVIFAVLTTIVAFMPILFLPGTSGKLWGIISIVVIATLIFSLIESLLILPAHLSTIKGPAKHRFKFTRYFANKQQAFVNLVEQFIQKIYRPFLAMVLRWRYTTISVFVAMFMIFSVVVVGGWLPLVFFPSVEGDMIVANVRFAEGTHIQKTRNAIEQMERTAQTLRKEILGEKGSDEFRGIVTTIGAQPMSHSGKKGGNVGEVAIELAPAETRVIANAEIVRRWREAIGNIPEAIELSFNSSLQNNGPGIDIELSGLKIEAIRNTANALKAQLREYPGVYDVQDSFETGKREIRIQIKPHAQNLGLNFDDLARQVRQAFYGEEVQRVQRGRDEVKVFIRYPEKERSSLYMLENMTIRLSNGAVVPLSNVANIEYDRGPGEIKRIDRKRIVRVTAYIEDSKTTSGKVMEDLRSGFFSTFSTQFPSIRWSLSGSQKNQKELIDAMINGFIMAILGIYALMAIPFRSYLQPLIVVSAIPFGLIGAIIGHLLLGLDVSLLSLSGMIAVSGVVVNDNLVLVDYINRARQQGASVAKAIREAGAARFRPILLTSLTTFAGLTPLMLEKSVQAQFLIPMAVSLAFGVMFATTVSLLLIPAAYYILEDVKNITEQKLFRKKNLANTTAKI
ncbi:MAG: efflux RND transporter permease subunit [Gammaproteobacteria bacterium]|nr:efflux RND transporter permease subunit [Gammaproteobacteria bacterium]